MLPTTKLRNTNHLSHLRDDFMFPVEQVFNEFFNSFWNDSTLESIKAKGSWPKLDIYEHGNEWVIEASVPGSTIDDIEVEVSEGPSGGRMVRITSRAESRREDAVYHCKELCKKYSTRHVGLPDKIKGDPEATIRDGILYLKWKVAPDPQEPKKKLIKIVDADDPRPSTG